MPIKVLVPRLGEGVEEVIITNWLKKEGDSVSELEPLLEVNTDKVDTEIPSPASGVLLKIFLEKDITAKVGEVLALIGQPGESVDISADLPEAPTVSEEKKTVISVSQKTQPKRQGRGELGFISPLVARMAAEHNVSLETISGSGLNGRITKEDVLDYLQNGEKTTGNPQSESRLIKHSAIRKSIAEHMLSSKKTSPHVLTVMEVDMSRVFTHRAVNKADFARDGAHLTFTAYFVSTISSALKANPLANSSWRDEGVLLHQNINIGMATSLGEEGLIVPVIKDADGLSLLGVARAVNDLATRARARKLQPDEVRGGTFTLTNHGVSGSLFAMPIINQPQCGILGVGALQKRAVVVTDSQGADALAIRPMVYLSFVFDHRILDGASADSFLMSVKQTLEKWE